MLIYGRNILNASRRRGDHEARRTLRAAPPVKELDAELRGQFKVLL